MQAILLFQAKSIKQISLSSMKSRLLTFITLHCLYLSFRANFSPKQSWNHENHWHSFDSISVSVHSRLKYWRRCSKRIGFAGFAYEIVTKWDFEAFWWMRWQWHWKLQQKFPSSLFQIYLRDWNWRVMLSIRVLCGFPSQNVCLSVCPLIPIWSWTCRPT